MSYCTLFGLGICFMNVTVHKESFIAFLDDALTLA